MNVFLDFQFVITFIVIELFIKFYFYFWMNYLLNFYHIRILKFILKITFIV
jgi:hypothetical protein